MTRKGILIAIGLIMIMLGVGMFFLFGRNGKMPTGGSGTTTQGENPKNPLQALIASTTAFSNAPQGATLVMNTPQGLVTINNFYKLDPPIDEEFLILANTNDYQITYDTENDQFFVYASSTPLDTARQEGESAFLQLLGISQGDACKLNVLEGFPQNSAMANEQPELSFCAASNNAFQPK